MTESSSLGLLADLQQKDIKIWFEDGNLRCSAPTGVMTSSLRDKLSQHKEELRRLLSGDRGPVERLPISSIDDLIGKPLPLSFTQERFWYLHELFPEVSAYHLQISMALPCTVDRIEKALKTVSERHAILRTTYAIGDDGPVQIVQASRAPQTEFVDMSKMSMREYSAASIRRAQEDVVAAYDLTAGPVWRALLIKPPSGDIDVFLTVHHIAADGWSMNLLKSELEALCTPSQAAAEPQSGQPRLQYADYARWHRTWMQGARLQAQLDYWQDQLEGAPPTIDMPTDHRRHDITSHRGAAQTMSVKGALVAALKSLAQSHRATVFMALLAVFKVLLFRYCGQTDVVVGAPFAGRNHPDLKHVVGPLLNTLVLRTDLSGNPTFAKLLARVRGTVLGAFEHQDMPFEKLVEALKPEQDTSRNPLFQVMFNYLVPQDDGGRPHGIEIFQSDEIIATAGAQVDLTLYVYEEADAVHTAFVYNTDLFEGGTIRRMLGHFECMLHEVARDPDRPIGQLPMLTTTEREFVLATGTGTAVPYPNDRSLYQLFEAQAARTPDAIAVSSGGRQLSYGELDCAANQLAQALGEAGAEPGAIIGICMKRSVDLLVGLLGILKTGAAYLPLDPTHPAERIAYIVENSQTKLIVTEPEFRDSLPPQAVALVAQQPLVESAPPPSGHVISSESLAYVIYTSGSTGKPKGVQVPHRAVVNFICSMAKQPGFSEADKLLAVTTVSFDIHVLELFLPLSVGGQVDIVEDDVLADPYKLLSRLGSSAPTVMQATPSTWRMLTEAGWREQKDLKILCGGEPLPPDLAQHLSAGCRELWNMYGPTETTVWSSIYRVPANDPAMLVGKPIDNTTFYILDANRQLLPIGVPGELVIGGAGVAKGYVGHPQLTEERFLTNPFHDEYGALMYMTGDVAKLLSDGNVELFGRLDHQVKVRGHRIELGEIESVLAQHPDLIAAVAHVRTDAKGAQQLLAYGIPAAPGQRTNQDYRSFLRRHLPDYMIPAQVVLLNAFPLTANGKIDRKALPAPPREVQRRKRQDTRPKGALEIAMARIWEELLDIDDVRANDTFFDVGGHSLLTVKVVVRFKRQTNFQISPADLVNQTLRQIVRGLETSGTSPKKESRLRVMFGAKRSRQPDGRAI